MRDARDQFVEWKKAFIMNAAWARATDYYEASNIWQAIPKPEVVDLTVPEAGLPHGLSTILWGFGVEKDADIVFEVWGWKTNHPNAHLGCDSWSDCERLSRKWEDENTADCSGCNGGCLFRAVMEPAFWEILQDAKVQIVRGLQERFKKPSPSWKRPYKHGFRCKHGRHRSLAVAHLLRMCFVLGGNFLIWIKTLTTTPCGCPCNCKKIKRWANKDELRERWELDGRTACMVARRYWAYAHI